jgi:hypothetical protein
MHSVLPMCRESLLSISHSLSDFSSLPSFWEINSDSLWENIIVLSSTYSTSLQSEVCQWTYHWYNKGKVRSQLSTFQLYSINSGAADCATGASIIYKSLV